MYLSAANFINLINNGETPTTSRTRMHFSFLHIPDYSPISFFKSIPFTLSSSSSLSLFGRVSSYLFSNDFNKADNLFNVAYKSVFGHN